MRRRVGDFERSLDGIELNALVLGLELGLGGWF